MADADGSERSARGAEADRTPAPELHEESLDHLRELLNAPERERLDALEARLRRFRVRARDISEVLPDALHMQDPEEGRVAKALEPHLGEAIRNTVSSNLGAIRDALVPVIGPIIRKYVRSALATMVESFNRALDQSFSIRGLRWRWEAWRTGQPFGEVVMLHTMRYRVEQLFLIHRPTGLLLQHVDDPAVPSRDPDMVSGMLSALRDFVRDSFDEPEGASVSSVQVGDLRLVVNGSDHAVLAAAVRGTPPEGLSRRLARTLERITSERAQDLRDFEGDAAAFRATRPLLEDHLVVELAHPARRVPVGTIVAATAALVALAWLALWASRVYFYNQAWNEGFALLQKEPGILLGATERYDGRWLVTGFRDPLAREPEEVLAGTTLDLDQAVFDWELFTSQHDPIVLKRAVKELDPPDGVRLEVSEHVLRVHGNPPADWLADLEARWSHVEGLHGYELASEEGPPAPADGE